MTAALNDSEVRQHDDGSAPGMHDLEIWRSNRRIGAVEVTAAADGESIELWKLVNGSDDRWIEPQLGGGWMVSVSPKARAKRLRAELPGLLAGLESAGLSEVDRRRERMTPGINAASDLGVISAHQGASDYAGSIYVTIDLPAERSGGVVAQTGNGLADWIGHWAAQPEQLHNVEKLRKSSADWRHLFVLLPGFTTAPFAVSDLLMRAGAPSPVTPATLPPGVTHVWAMSTWSSGDGFFWSTAEGWTRFAKVFEVEDS